jgi:hypothetical protein
MSSLPNGKDVIRRLTAIWRDIVARGEASGETGYRMQKLSRRLDAVMEKMFIKTVKARDLLMECLQLTEQVKVELDRHASTDFKLLTRLEHCVDELVRKTYEFRVKAG